jgi:CBS domain-containing protein
MVDEHLTAKDIMIAKISIDSNETISCAVDIMKKKSITFLPVVNNKNELLGIIDLADIFSATFKKESISPDVLSLIHDLKSSNDLIFEPIQHFWENEEKHIVGEILRDSSTYTVNENASYTDIVFLMTKYHHRYLVVIDNEKQVKGLIDTDDIVHKMIRI